MGARFEFLRREWRGAAAALALLSLIPLGLLLLSGDRFALSDEQEIQRIRRRIEAREFGPAESLVEAFLRERPSSPLVPEAAFLLARARLGIARENPKLGPAEIEAVWNQFRAARGRADRRACEDGWIETANLYRDRGFYAEAHEKYRELLPLRPEVTLEFAVSLAAQARTEAPSSHLLAEAEHRIEEYLRSAQGEPRVQALLVRTRIFWLHGSYEEMERTAGQGAQEFPDRAEFRLERGKALVRLRRLPEAVAELEAARKSTREISLWQESLYFEAEGRLRSGDPSGIALVQDLSGSRSTLAPLANLLLGRFRLDQREEEALPTLKKALIEIPALSGVAPYAPDIEGLVRRLMEEAEREADPRRIDPIVSVMEEILRLDPDRLDARFEVADLQARAGSRLRDGGLRISAARSYDRIASHPRASRSEVARAHWNAAQAYFAGNRFAQAAHHYQVHFETDPKRNLDSLYHQGLSLWNAGSPRTPAVFEEYLRRAGPGGPRTPDVVIYRGRWLIEADRPAEAIEGFDPLLRGAEYGLDPRHPRWSEALLLKGLALLEIALRAADEERRRPALVETRRALNEYLERYAEGLDPITAPPAGALEACDGLARAAQENRAWSEAARFLERLLELAASIPASEREVQSGVVRRAYFRLGDLYLNEERYPEALRAYETAFRKYPTTDDRLGALLGRTRTLFRLGRHPEAAEALQSARQVYESDRERFDRSLGGQGRDYWTGTIRDVEREIEPWTTRRS